MFFEYPKLLFGELILIPLIALYIFKELKGVHPALTVSNLDQWKKGGKTLKVWLRHLPFIWRMVAIALIIVAIARPRSSEQFERMDTEGIDIVLPNAETHPEFAEVFYEAIDAGVEVLYLKCMVNDKSITIA